MITLIKYLEKQLKLEISDVENYPEVEGSDHDKKWQVHTLAEKTKPGAKYQWLGTGNLC